MTDNPPPVDDPAATRKLPALASESPSNRRLIRVQTTCLLVIAGGVIAGTLYLLQSVMIPVALALVLAYALSPVVALLTTRCKLPRMAAVATTLVAVSLTLLGIGYLASISIDSTMQSGGTYQKTLATLGQQLGVPFNIETMEIERAALDEPGLKGKVLAYLTEAPVGDWAGSLANQVLGAVSTFGLIIIFALFMLMHDAPPASDSLRARVAARVKHYLAIKFVLSLTTGVLVGVSLALIGIDLAFLIGVLTLALNFIPHVGSIIAIVLPLPLAFLTDDPRTSVLLVLLIPGLIQFVIGNIIEPRYLGDELRLHPVTVLAALIFWGTLWGAPGLLLAVPLTTAAHIAAGETVLTRPIGDLLSGRFLEPEYDG